MPEHEDKHWKEVMDMAKQYGFIVQAYGGTATLATHKNQKELLGEEKYKDIQRMNGRCLKNLGYSESECPTVCERCFLTPRERGYGYGVHYL